MSEASAGSPPPARPVGPPLTGDSTLDVDPLAELGAQRPNLEHRRIVSVVRRRLFGSGHPPRIGRYTIEHRLGRPFAAVERALAKGDDIAAMRQRARADIVARFDAESVAFPRIVAYFESLFR